MTTGQQYTDGGHAHTVSLCLFTRPQNKGKWLFRRPPKMDSGPITRQPKNGNWDQDLAIHCETKICPNLPRCLTKRSGNDSIFWSSRCRFAALWIINVEPKPKKGTKQEFVADLQEVGTAAAFADLVMLLDDLSRTRNTWIHTLQIQKQGHSIVMSSSIPAYWSRSQYSEIWPINAKFHHYSGLLPCMTPSLASRDWQITGVITFLVSNVGLKLRAQGSGFRAQGC